MQRQTGFLWGILLLTLILGVQGVCAQNIEWQNLLGGLSDDGGNSIKQMPDGGYILTGHTQSNNSGDVGLNHGGYDVWVVKLSSPGTSDWQKVLGGNRDDSGKSIQKTADGGYVLTGYTVSSNNGDVGLNHGWYDVWVVKLSSTGNIDWQKVLGGWGYEEGDMIQQTADGGYILVGWTESNNSGDVGANHGEIDIWVVKLTSTGTIDWQKVLGGNLDEMGFSIQQTADGGYILTGYTWSSNNGDVGANHGMQDVWVVKLTSTGTIDWQKVLGGINDDYGHCIQQTADGGYIVTGYTSSSNNGDVGANHGFRDIWVVKLTSTGAIDWQKVLGGSDLEYGTSIQQTADGGYILTGDTWSSNSGDVGENHGRSDIWVVKLTSTGAIDWQKVLGGSKDEAGGSIQQTADDRYILVGTSDSNNDGDMGFNHGMDDVWVVKLISSSINPFPGWVNPPTDPDGDGFYEDINGNGLMDYDDAVVLFWNIQWIQNNEPVSAFDFNGNGIMDYDDAVTLFWEI